MRKQPAKPPRHKLTDIKDERIITMIRDYELITPLFGGGVKANEMDPVTPIRGSEIRGQLRFWWRACRGGNPAFKSELQNMKEAEEWLWGAAAVTKKDANGKEIPGPRRHETIQIQVQVQNRGKDEDPFSRNGNSLPIPQYAVFPLQQSRRPVRSGITFRMTITFSETKDIPTDNHPAEKLKVLDEIEAALWAWETFGGIGARTRRGFGAIKCTNITCAHEGVAGINLPPEQRSGAEAWLQKNIQTHVIQDGNWPAHVPHINPNTIKEQTFRLLVGNDARQVWKSLIDKLKNFRQYRLKNGYGKSLWPEPDVIRSMQRLKSLKKGQRKIFPRAAFGLPIVFHFKQQRNYQEPTDTTLRVSETEERMASPLILRPLACQHNRYLGLAIVLAGYDIPREQSEVVLQNQSTKEKQQGIARITDDEASQIPPLKGNPDVLQAFLKTF